jgi:hypothetical protein
MAGAPDPWLVEESGFDPARASYVETLFGAAPSTNSCRL